MQWRFLLGTDQLRISFLSRKVKTGNLYYSGTLAFLLRASSGIVKTCINRFVHIVSHTILQGFSSEISPGNLLEILPGIPKGISPHGFLQIIPPAIPPRIPPSIFEAISFEISPRVPTVNLPRTHSFLPGFLNNFSARASGIPTRIYHAYTFRDSACELVCSRAIPKKKLLKKFRENI